MARWGIALPSSCSGPFLAQDQLESVLEVLHRQTEQYRDQPQHLEKITCQQRLLQEDLVHIRAELCRESTEMENAWNEYLKLEKDVEQLKQTLQEQHRRAFFFQVTKREGCHLPHLHHQPVRTVSSA